ncbi:hypothetical protein HBB16_17145 [Pseudonocardia sp. MCCB 268]|nr:hypothetical protein [Pseudonocardia cytotoxica]
MAPSVDELTAAQRDPFGRVSLFAGGFDATAAAAVAGARSATSLRPGREVKVRRRHRPGPAPVRPAETLHSSAARRRWTRVPARTPRPGTASWCVTSSPRPTGTAGARRGALVRPGLAEQPNVRVAFAAALADGSCGGWTTRCAWPGRARLVLVPLSGGRRASAGRPRRSRRPARSLTRLPWLAHCGRAAALPGGRTTPGRRGRGRRAGADGPGAAPDEGRARPAFRSVPAAATTRPPRRRRSHRAGARGGAPPRTGSRVRRCRARSARSVRRRSRHGDRVRGSRRAPRVARACGHGFAEGSARWNLTKVYMTAVTRRRFVEALLTVRLIDQPDVTSWLVGPHALAGALGLPGDGERGALAARCGLAVVARSASSRGADGPAGL